MLYGMKCVCLKSYERLPILYNVHVHVHALEPALLCSYNEVMPKHVSEIVFQRRTD